MKGLPPLARGPSPGILQGGGPTQALQRTQKTTGPWPLQETLPLLTTFFLNRWGN